MIRATITGGQELDRALQALGAGIRREVTQRILLQAAAPIVRTAKAHAPRGPDAPHLADSISAWPLPARGGEDQGAVGIGPGREFFYDFFWEYGFRHVSARPFWRPAFDQEAPTAFGIAMDQYWTAIAAEGTR